MRAASYSSAGMPCRPPRAMTIMNGKPSQTLAMMQAANAGRRLAEPVDRFEPQHCRAGSRSPN